MSRRALIVGCNYPGTKNALNGCVNDAHTVRDLLVNVKGFPPENVQVMIDTDNSTPMPTGENIRKALSDLVAISKPGDSLVFHFSGHGTQVPSKDQCESDAKDEAICPTDLNLIIDDDLCDVVSKLADGVDFLMISDCCHSGNMLDQHEVQITGDKGGKQQQVTGPSLLDLLGGRAIDSNDCKNRSMPVNDLCALLTERSGIPTTSSNIRSTLGTMFGAQAGKLVNNLVTKYAGDKVGLVAGNLVTSFLSGQKLSLGSAFGSPQAPQQQQQQAQPAGPPKLNAEKGILITGCRDFETSADACPSGDKSKAFGALTNSLSNIVRNNPSMNYYDLVTEIRNQLKAGGFTQNPCLECSINNAQKPFAAPT